MDILQDIEKAYPTLGDDIQATGQIVDRYMTDSSDIVSRWIMGQWHASIISLPTAPHPQNSMALLDHLGAISLAMQRIGIPEFPTFQSVAANLLRIFTAIHGAAPTEPPAPDGTVLH